MTPRKVAYTYLHPTGGESPVEEAPLADLLMDVPSLVYFGRMPPLAVVNTFLAAGIADAGMGGGASWAPFQISEGEYNSLVADLRANTTQPGRRPKRFDSVPDHVRSKNQWFAWVYHADLGAPYEEALRHLERNSELKAKRDAAYNHGRDVEGEALHWEWDAAAIEMWAFLDPYLERRRNERPL